MEINYSLANEINLDNNLENKQNKFLESNLGKVINTGVDMGIRYLLPDLIEDQVIDVKDAMGMEMIINPIVRYVTIISILLHSENFIAYNLMS